MIYAPQHQALAALADVHYLVAEQALAAANAALIEATARSKACDDAVAAAVSDWRDQLAQRFAPDMMGALAEIVRRRVTSAAEVANQQTAYEQRRDTCEATRQNCDAKRRQAEELARAADRRDRRKNDERVMAATADQFLMAKGRP